MPNTVLTLQDKPLGEHERRWASSTHHSTDIDSDYRRELATSGGFHQEARGRDGAVFRRHRAPVAAEVASDSSPVPTARSSGSAREEERRKVLEIEEERLRREREVQQLRRAGGGVGIGRSTSRVGPRIVKADNDSQYSGHSSSSAVRREPSGAGPGGGGRFDPNKLARIKRSTSNATNASSRVNSTTAGGVRRELLNRKKLPGSVTSSVNSSESDQGAAANAAAAASAGNRSVFLHAACVADIPPNTVEATAAAVAAVKRTATQPPPQQQQQRALSTESRDNVADGVGASSLQKSKKISRSISLLTPWKPKPVQKQFSEIHYDNGNIYGMGGGTAGKPPRPPPVRRGGPSPATMQRDKKSASSTNLLRDDSSSDPMTSEERGRRILVQKKPSKVSRSVSMPKDTRLAGWFKKRKQRM